MKLKTRLLRSHVGELRELINSSRSFLSFEIWSMVRRDLKVNNGYGLYVFCDSAIAGNLKKIRVHDLTELFKFNRVFTLIFHSHFSHSFSKHISNFTLSLHTFFTIILHTNSILNSYSFF